LFFKNSTVCLKGKRQTSNSCLFLGWGGGWWTETQVLVLALKGQCVDVHRAQVLISLTMPGFES